MNVLDELGKLYGTGKSSEVHNFCEKYDKYLPFKRYDKIKILEIGVLNGQSLKMWKDWYINCKIVGIDIDENCKTHENDGNSIFVEIGSQTDKSFLLNVTRKYGDFDLIIDDGSHINSNVIFSFEILFDQLKSGGVYVVEDSFTSYLEDFGGGYLKENSIMEYFKKLSDDINFRGLLNHDVPHLYSRAENYLIDLSKEVQPDCRVDVESINFLNGIIIVTKR